MKLNTIIVLLLAISVNACTNGADTVDSNTDSRLQVQENHEVDHQQPASLSLNNGQKWNGDQSTNLHAERLISQVELFNSKKNPDLQAYQNFGADMQNELNSLIKNCKMSGPDHDALHLWIEPVLRNVNDLTKATLADDPKELAQKLTEDVLRYSQYFN